MLRCSKNHAANGSSSGKTSGTATPSRSSGSGSTTPRTLVAESDTYEKLERRPSFYKAVIAPLPRGREPMSSGLSKEQSEHGRVKKKVYMQFLQAASKTGFCFFVLVTVLGQMVSVMSTMMLRFWGERNRESGTNAGLTDPYLLGYGFLSLASIVLSAAAGLLIIVLCALRSSKYLHESVRWPSLGGKKVNGLCWQMLESIMRAPLSFFEITPIGRYGDLLTICLMRRTVID
jgi:ATP-binding cassette subfamily C (CFTR/MRP) protein 1